nr:hypothetical protein [Tanacetum cinerariifolium]
MAMAPTFVSSELWYYQPFSQTQSRSRIDNGSEFINQTLREYYEKVGISHETSVARSLQQNGVIERRNRTLIEAARTISLEPVLHEMTPATISSRLVPNPPPLTSFVPPSKSDWDLLFQPLFDELLTPPPSVDHLAPEVIAPIAKVVAPEPVASIGSPSSTIVDQDAPSPSKSQTTPETQTPVISNDVEKENHDLDVAHMNNDPFVGIKESPKTPTFRDDALHEYLHEDSTSQGSSSNIRKNPHFIRITWEMDQGSSYCKRDWRSFSLSMTEPSWIDAMQEEIHEFERLQVWELVSCSGSDTLHTKSRERLITEKSKVDNDLQGKPVDVTLYRGMIGSLLYLTSSRRDLTYAVCLCARMSLTAYADADHAGCQDTRRSTSGSAKFLDYGFRFNKTLLYCDNKSAIALCCNSVQHSRARHIDVRYHFIKEQVENGILELYFGVNVQIYVFRIIDTTQAQQKALDDDLVAPANRLKIGKRNLRLIFTLKSKEPTLQVVLDALKLTPFFKRFKITVDVPEIYMQEFWVTNSIHHTSLHFKMNGKSHTVNVDNFRDMFQIFPKLPGQKFEDPSFEKEILSFIRDLRHTGEIKVLSDVNGKKKLPAQGLETLSEIAFGSGAHEGTSFKPVVLDASKYGSNDEQISWKSSNEDDDDKNTAADDDDQEDDLSTFDKEERRDEKLDEEDEGLYMRVQTPSNFESNDDEAYDDSSFVSSGFITNMLNINLDTGINSILNLNTELTSLVDVPVTMNIEMPYSSVTTLPPPPIPLVQPQQQTPVLTPVSVLSTSLHNLPTFGSLFKFEDRVKTLEENFLEFKQTNLFAKAVSSILGIVDMYLANKMNEAAKTAKIINDQVKVQVKEHVSKILPRIEKLVNEQPEDEVLTRSSNKAKTSHAVAGKISELELKKILIDKMESNKSIDRSAQQNTLYKASIDAYETDKVTLDPYGDTITIKRRRDDEDEDEEPSVGSNRGSKRRRAGKERSHPVHQWKIPPSHLASLKKGLNLIKSTLASLKAAKSPTLDRDWNKTLPAAHRQTQPWINNLVWKEDIRDSFNELMDTPLDFSAFVMNRLKIDTLTLELLAGLTFELMKRSCKSLVELEYFLKEVYKATTDQLDWNNPEDLQYQHVLRKPLPLIPNSQGRRVIPFDHFINNDLAYLWGYASSRTYATSVTKNKAADYGHINWIEDLVPNTMWSPLPNKYKKNKLMRIDELYKFNDGTLNDVRTALDDIMKKIRMKYLPQTYWRNGDKEREGAMI